VSKQNPLTPFNELIDNAIAAEMGFFRSTDGSYDKIGLSQSLKHTFRARPPVVMGVALCDILQDAHVDNRMDRYFRDVRVVAGPSDVIGMRKVVQFPIPGMREFMAKEFIRCNRGELRRYDDYLLSRRDEFETRHQFIDKLLARMDAAGAVQDSDPVLPHLTNDERLAFQ
jgi:hypothetical protein